MTYKWAIFGVSGGRANGHADTCKIQASEQSANVCVESREWVGEFFEGSKV